MKVFFRTYGCALNQYDSLEMMSYLKRRNHTIVDSIEQADVVVINSCTVKMQTENKIFDFARSLLSLNKPFVFAGCLTTNRNRIKKEIPNPVILTPQCLEKIPEAVEYAVQHKQAVFDKLDRTFSHFFSISPPISIIGINVGCTGNCTFCQTKAARRKLVSQKPKQIIRKIEQAVQNKCVEIDLASQDSGAYGLDINSNLISLLNQAINVPGNYRLRLGMINPHHAARMKYDLVPILNNKHFYKFLHIPIQSGSNSVLRDMARVGTVEEFEETVKFFRKNVPNISISTDIIVGFPTETDEDFIKTIELIKRIKPDFLNISKYTARQNTPAKALKQLKTQTIKQRSKQLSDIYKQISIKNLEKEKNKLYSGFVLKKRQGYFLIKSENYKEIKVNDQDLNIGDFLEVRIQKDLLGKIEKRK